MCLISPDASPRARRSRKSNGRSRKPSASIWMVCARTERRSRRPRRSANTSKRESRFAQNEQRPPKIARDSYWPDVVFRCKRADQPRSMTIKNSAQPQRDEIRKIDHYALKVATFPRAEDSRGSDEHEGNHRAECRRKTRYLRLGWPRNSK